MLTPPSFGSNGAPRRKANKLCENRPTAARKGIKAGEPESDLAGVKMLPVVGGRQDMNLIKERTKRFETIFFKKN